MQSIISKAQAEEDADTRRLQKSSYFVAYCKEKESTALRELAEAQKQLARAREKHSALFQECEKRACARREAGLIVNTANY